MRNKLGHLVPFTRQQAPGGRGKPVRGKTEHRRIVLNRAADVLLGSQAKLAYQSTICSKRARNAASAWPLGITTEGFDPSYTCLPSIRKSCGSRLRPVMGEVRCRRDPARARKSVGWIRRLSRALSLGAASANASSLSSSTVPRRRTLDSLARRRARHGGQNHPIAR